MKMRLKKRLAIILACVCAVYTLCPVSVSHADELEDAQGQSSDLKNELDSINQGLLEISNKIAENESKMESMEGDIIKTQEQLSIAKKNEEAQYEDMKVRIQDIYENDRVRCPPYRNKCWYLDHQGIRSYDERTRRFHS